MVTGNELTLHTARSGACRSGAVRSGFAATATQDHKTGSGSPNTTGGNFYIYAEVIGPTTSWTVIKEP